MNTKVLGAALVAVFMLFSIDAFSQCATPNLALTATANHSGGGSGTYGPSAYNDQYIGPCNPVPSRYGWVSSNNNSGLSAWISFDWGNTTVTFTEIMLYYGNNNARYVDQFTLQYWNGSAWVTSQNFNFTSPYTCERVVPCNSVTTTRMRMTNFHFAVLGQQSNANFREIEIRNCVTAPNDAGISSIDSPLNFCPGMYPVIATLQNFGTNQITSVTINWELNGVPQLPAISWTGMLDTLNATTRRTQVTLHPGMNFAANTPYHFRAWTTMPNGQPDTVNANDETDVTRKASLAGTFTIGGASPDYANFTDAVDDINTNGLCGPVVFNVRSGTYTEQVEIEDIAGSSPVNTVTFQSETGVNTDVTLRYSGTSSTNYHTLWYNGCEYVTFQNMTIRGTGASYARVVRVSGGASYNKVLNNRIYSSGNGSSSYRACIWDETGNDDYNEFSYNIMQNAFYGFYIYGGGTNSPQKGTKIIGNDISNIYYANFFYYQGAFEIRDNKISITSTYTHYGLYVYYPQEGGMIEGNQLYLSSPSTNTQYGMYIYRWNYYSGSSNRGLVANNFVTIRGNGASTPAFRIYYCDYTDVYHNTAYKTSTYNNVNNACLYLYQGIDLNVMDNIFHHAGAGYAAYYYPGANINNCDYNVYYTAGNNFVYWSGNRANLQTLQAASGKDANSIEKPVNFADPGTGDLHLVGTSQNDIALTGQLLSLVPKDIDDDPRVVPYRGADEACYILPGTVTGEIVDATGNPLPYAEIPGTIYVKYGISFPDFAANITITVNFWSITTSQLEYSTSFTVAKQYMQPATGIQAVSVPPTVPVGYYRVELIYNTPNSCEDYINYKPGDGALLLVPQGQQPCVVWPGDVNNDGIVNYGDRKSLNKYMQDANMQMDWLFGPARYRPDFATNPMTYYTWVGQAAAPWKTADGCYMDADGNGNVNTYDYLPIKINFMNKHGATPKSGDRFAPETFDMSRNYPNPFTSMTTLRYSVSERSRVDLVVTDVSGREVAVLVNGEVTRGVRTVQFDASNLESGTYFARVRMTGLESGLEYSRMVKMTLSK